MHLLLRLYGQPRISHHFLALYAETAKADPDLQLGEAVFLTYVELHHREPDEQTLLQICERLAAHGEKVASQPEKKPAVAGIKKQNFGEYYDTFLSELDLSSVCLWIAGYDPERARALYYDEDYEVFDELVKVKLRDARETARLHFEGALFGFGGSYGTGGKVRGVDEGDVTIHDPTRMSGTAYIDLIANAGKRTLN